MRTYYLKLFKPLQFTGLLTVLLLVVTCKTAVYAQVLPPRPILAVNSLQGLSFGAFVQGSNGGTVTIFPNGSRTVTGDIIQASMGHLFTPALFYLTANLGTLITIQNGPDITLTDGKGGTMNLHLDASEPVSPFTSKVDNKGRTEVRIGGILTVGNPSHNPPGLYSGEFYINFIQQ